MRLPAHLDYDEVSTDGEDGREWWPEVRCLVQGCAWRYDAAWDDMGEDGGVDWLVEHPTHAPASP